MTSCFVCATLNLGHQKSTGTEPYPFSSTRLELGPLALYRQIVHLVLADEPGLLVEPALWIARLALFTYPFSCTRFELGPLALYRQIVHFVFADEAGLLVELALCVARLALDGPAQDLHGIEHEHVVLDVGGPPLQVFGSVVEADEEPLTDFLLRIGAHPAPPFIMRGILNVKFKRNSNVCSHKKT